MQDIILASPLDHVYPARRRERGFCAVWPVEVSLPAQTVAVEVFVFWFCRVVVEPAQ